MRMEGICAPMRRAGHVAHLIRQVDHVREGVDQVDVEERILQCIAARILAAHMTHPTDDAGQIGLRDVLVRVEHEDGNGDDEIRENAAEVVECLRRH